MITLNQFSRMIPRNKNPEPWFNAAEVMFKKYSINTPNRIAGFMAQCGHESGDFTMLEENLNYSVSNLLRVFPRYFGKGKANPAEYANNPQKLANYVYMDVNRSKGGALGNTQPGDGWKFRGRGIKQLTGRSNYAAFGASVGMTADEAAEYVATPKGAFESACWFWETRKLNAVADSDNIVQMTKIINGGNIGLDDRKFRYNRAKAILAEGVATSQTTVAKESAKPAPSRPAAQTPKQQPANTPASTRVAIQPNTQLKRGSTGDLVRHVNRALGLTADNTFNLQTEVAVRSWQRSNKYTVTGILDQQQTQKLLQGK